MNNQKQFEKESEATLVTLGGEELAGSGFEDEIPDSDFAESEILAQPAGRNV